MAKKIIFIEGPDRCGKDTIIKNTISKLNEDGLKVKTYHCIGPGPDDICKGTVSKCMFQLCSFYDQLRTAIEDDSDIYIFNRSFLGEYVWSKFFERDDQIPRDFVVNTIFNSKLFKDNIDKFVGLFITVDADRLLPRVVSSTEDNGIYTKCFEKDPNKNIEFVLNSFDELKDITKEKIKTVEVKSNILEDLNANTDKLIEICKS